MSNAPHCSTSTGTLVVRKGNAMTLIVAFAFNLLGAILSYWRSCPLWLDAFVTNGCENWTPKGHKWNDGPMF